MPSESFECEQIQAQLTAAQSRVAELTALCDEKVINSEAYYDDEDARNLLRLSVRALNKACKTGGLRHRLTTGGRKLFKGEWLIAWINAQPSQSEHERITALSADNQRLRELLREAEEWLDYPALRDRIKAAIGEGQ